MSVEWERLPNRPESGRRHPPGTPVWVHLDGDWRPGSVVSGAETAVTARYRLAGQRGTGVDTVTWMQVATAVRIAPDRLVGETNGPARGPTAQARRHRGGRPGV